MAAEPALTPRRPRLELPTWATRRHPIFRAESARRLGGPGLRRFQMSLGPLMLGSAGVMQAIALGIMFLTEGLDWQYATVTFTAVTFWLFVFIHVVSGLLISIQSVALVAPLISVEVELQSWGLLRTTTLPLHEIVLAKLAAAVNILRWPIGTATLLRFFSWLAFILWIGAIFVERNSYYSGSVYRSNPLAWLEPGWLIFAFIALVFWVAQPLVNLGINGGLGLWASCMVRNRGQAVSLGLALRLGLWIGAIILNIAVIMLINYLVFTNWFQGQYAPLAIFRLVRPPTQEEQTSILLALAGGYLLSWLAVQIGLSAFFTGLALRRAARIGS